LFAGSESDRERGALDARMQMETDGYRAPYPPEPETTVALPSGERLRIRPIRPEDEAALTDMVARMSADDRRLRFFAVTKGLTHELAARLTRLDDTREMALIAQALDNDEILGAARFSADRDQRDAEFAVTVRSDWKGRGVGWALMEKLVDAARHCGLATLSGLVLTENRNMLRFCRDLGFTIAGDPDDPAMVHASLTLPPRDAGD
jgi:acetyltransferase